MIESRSIIAILASVIVGSQALADVKVAFFELRDAAGKLVRLEAEGRFYHVAVSHDGQWLHAHPWRGVELTSLAEISKIACHATTVEVKGLKSLPEAKVKAFVGRPFDRDFSWDDEKLYCSEAVGKVLDLEPEPMVFDPELWPEKYLELDGQPGISPDDVFRRLSERGFKSVETGQCE